MATHKLLVTIYDGDRMVYEDELVDYNGQPDWKYEPLDPVLRERWAETVADPERVSSTHDRQSTTTRGGKGLIT